MNLLNEYDGNMIDLKRGKFDFSYKINYEITNKFYCYLFISISCIIKPLFLNASTIRKSKKF